jgi:hypothetical protein
MSAQSSGGVRGLEQSCELRRPIGRWLIVRQSSHASEVRSKERER